MGPTKRGREGNPLSISRVRDFGASLPPSLATQCNVVVIDKRTTSLPWLMTRCDRVQYIITLASFFLFFVVIERQRVGGGSFVIWVVDELRPNDATKLTLFIIDTNYPL